jgi:hypothetical protein
MEQTEQYYIKHKNKSDWLIILSSGQPITHSLVLEHKVVIVEVMGSSPYYPLSKKMQEKKICTSMYFQYHANKSEYSICSQTTTRLVCKFS